VSEFQYSDLLPLGSDSTQYRLLTNEGVSVEKLGGHNFLRVESSALTNLTFAAMRDISHLLRSDHLAQLKRILEDPEASPNDRFVALDLLKNANIAAGGILPMCQDTGTAIIMGKRGQYVLTSGQDSEDISRGVFDAFEQLNLRYSQLSPINMWEERNTGTNLPAQIELYSDPSKNSSYEFLFMAKGGGSANKSFLYQETAALLNIPPCNSRRWNQCGVRTEDRETCISPLP